MSNITSVQLRAAGIDVPNEPTAAKPKRAKRQAGLVDFAVTRDARAVTITLPIRTESESNMREHHFARLRRKNKQQATLAMLIGQAMPFPCRPLDVSMTRIGKGTLDDDNLAGSFKHVQDGLARAFGIDDGDRSKVTWHYAQEHGKAYGVRVRIAMRSRA